MSGGALVSTGANGGVWEFSGRFVGVLPSKEVLRLEISRGGLGKLLERLRLAVWGGERWLVNEVAWSTRTWPFIEVQPSRELDAFLLRTRQKAVKRLRVGKVAPLLPEVLMVVAADGCSASLIAISEAGCRRFEGGFLGFIRHGRCFALLADLGDWEFADYSQYFVGSLHQQGRCRGKRCPPSVSRLGSSRGTAEDGNDQSA